MGLWNWAGRWKGVVGVTAVGGVVLRAEWRRGVIGRRWAGRDGPLGFTCPESRAATASRPMGDSRGMATRPNHDGNASERAASGDASETEVSSGGRGGRPANHAPARTARSLERRRRRHGWRLRQRLTGRTRGGRGDRAQAAEVSTTSSPLSVWAPPPLTRRENAEGVFFGALNEIRHANDGAVLRLDLSRCGVSLRKAKALGGAIGKAARKRRLGGVALDLSRNSLDANSLHAFVEALLAPTPLPSATSTAMAGDRGDATTSVEALHGLFVSLDLQECDLEDAPVDRVEGTMRPAAEPLLQLLLSVACERLERCVLDSSRGLSERSAELLVRGLAEAKTSPTDPAGNAANSTTDARPSPLRRVLRAHNLYPESALRTLHDVAQAVARERAAREEPHDSQATGAEGVTTSADPSTACFALGGSTWVLQTNVPAGPPEALTASATDAEAPAEAVETSGLAGIESASDDASDSSDDSPNSSSSASPRSGPDAEADADEDELSQALLDLHVGAGEASLSTPVNDCLERVLESLNKYLGIDPTAAAGMPADALGTGMERANGGSGTSLFEGGIFSRLLSARSADRSTSAAAKVDEAAAGASAPAAADTSQYDTETPLEKLPAPLRAVLQHLEVMEAAVTAACPGASSPRETQWGGVLERPVSMRQYLYACIVQRLVQTRCAAVDDALRQHRSVNACLAWLVQHPWSNMLHAPIMEMVAGVAEGQRWKATEEGGEGYRVPGAQLYGLVAFGDENALLSGGATEAPTTAAAERLWCVTRALYEGTVRNTEWRASQTAAAPKRPRRHPSLACMPHLAEALRMLEADAQQDAQVQRALQSDRFYRQLGEVDGGAALSALRQLAADRDCTLCGPKPMRPRPGEGGERGPASIFIDWSSLLAALKRTQHGN